MPFGYTRPQMFAVLLESRLNRHPGERILTLSAVFCVVLESGFVSSMTTKLSISESQSFLPHLTSVIVKPISEM